MMSRGGGGDVKLDYLLVRGYKCMHVILYIHTLVYMSSNNL